jgi:hypothetical protein
MLLVTVDMHLVEYIFTSHPPGIHPPTPTPPPTRRSRGQGPKRRCCSWTARQGCSSRTRRAALCSRRPSNSFTRLSLIRCAFCTLKLTHPPTQLSTHPPTHKGRHVRTHARTCARAHAPIYHPPPNLTHPPTHPLKHPPAPPTHSLTHVSIFPHVYARARTHTHTYIHSTCYFRS